MNSRMNQAKDWLQKEIQKDKVEISNHKSQMIEEVKKLDKTKMFQPKPKVKVSIIDKILMVLGYGKKR